MKNLILAKMIVLILFLSITSIAVSQVKSVDYIDPTIGGVGHLLQPCRPTVQLPNQMVRMYPMRQDYIDDQISWFPMSLIGHRQGELFGLKPITKNYEEDIFEEKLTYDHDLEITRPWYYSTNFIEEETFLEFTPSQKSGFFRFDFKNNKTKSIFFKIMNQGSWEIIENKIITGEEIFKDMKAFVYAELNYKTKNPDESISSDFENSEAWITFDSSVGSVIELKYGFSFISLEQAKKNLSNEIPHWNFENIKNSAKTKWEKVIGQIEVQGGTEAQKRTFYTSLYRTYERMINVTEDGKYFSGYDCIISACISGFRIVLNG